MVAEAGRIVVAGADGFVGRLLVRATGGVPVAYGPPGSGEIAMEEAGAMLRSAAVVISAGGLRVRPGLGPADYRQSHAGAVETLASSLSADQSLVLISSASVLGRDPRQVLGNRTAPRPETFPHPVYARAKLEAEDIARRRARERGFRLLVLRPAGLYGGAGDGMIGSLAALAKRGICLRLLPGGARQHLCSALLLAAAVRRAIEPGVLWPEEALVMADPFVLTNSDLERAAVAAAARAGRRRFATVPLPPWAGGTVLRFLPASRRPSLDLETWGAILQILGLDTQFEPGPSFEALGLDATRFSRDLTWDRVAAGEALSS
jgi:nucleoside-diphosphate-sugar epimerase